MTESLATKTMTTATMITTQDVVEGRRFEVWELGRLKRGVTRMTCNRHQPSHHHREFCDHRRQHWGTHTSRMASYRTPTPPRTLVRWSPGRLAPGRTRRHTPRARGRREPREWREVLLVADHTLPTAMWQAASALLQSTGLGTRAGAPCTTKKPIATWITMQETVRGLLWDGEQKMAAEHGFVAVRLLKHLNLVHSNQFCTCMLYCGSQAASPTCNAQMQPVATAVCVKSAVATVPIVNHSWVCSCAGSRNHCIRWGSRSSEGAVLRGQHVPASCSIPPNDCMLRWMQSPVQGETGLKCKSRY